MKNIGISIFLFFCVVHNSFVLENKSITVNENTSSYTNSIRDLYPSFEIEPSLHTSAFQSFYYGKNVEAYESQTKRIIMADENYHFEGHYIHTVVIAIDRNQTDIQITHFKDLFTVDESINFNFGKENGKKLWDLPEAQYIVLSIAQALYNSFDIEAIAKDFFDLDKQNRFFTNDETKPISVLYDTDAVELIKQGRNLEIIIPQDGTYSFIGGLLAYKDMSLSSTSFDSLLLENGMRLVNESAGEYFPHSQKYSYAKFVEDFDVFNNACSNVGSIMRTDAFEYERYGFADNKSRAVFFLVFEIIMAFYIISIKRRLINKKIRSAIITVCILQIVLVSMGCLKALTVDNPLFETILWYGYYIAFVYIPAIYLYVAIISGKNRETISISVYYRIYFVISTLLVLFVTSNNFHGLVFTVYDYSNSTFDYNTGYFIVMGWIYITMCVSLGILMYKVFKMPRKNALLLPFIMNIITITFMIGYARRIPIFYDFDFAYSINIIILLYIEACVQSKLFLANTHYYKMFSNSRLCMEIQNKEGITVEYSQAKIEPDRDYILKRTEMLSGSFLYYEDYTDLNKIKLQLEETNKKLEKNNRLLKKQSNVKAELASLAAEKVVYESIDNIIKKDTPKVESLLKEMNNVAQASNLVGRINILVCGIKRKCILRVNTLYKKYQSVETFLGYIGEMQEFTKGLPLRITVGCRYFGDFSISYAMLMYELFCKVVEEAAINGCSDILVQVYEENGEIIFSVIPDEKITLSSQVFEMQADLDRMGGRLSIKEGYDASAVLLCFKKDEGTA